jgi:hypothetical protein
VTHHPKITSNPLKHRNLPPEIPEAIRSHLRIPGCVLDISMAEIML